MVRSLNDYTPQEQDVLDEFDPIDLEYKALPNILGVMNRSPFKRLRPGDELDVTWRPNVYPVSVNGILTHFGILGISKVAEMALVCMHGLREVHAHGNMFMPGSFSQVKAGFLRSLEDYRADADIVNIPHRGTPEYTVNPKFFQAAQAFHNEAMTTYYTEFTEEQLLQWVMNGQVGMNKRLSLLELWTRMLFWYMDRPDSFALIQRTIDQAAQIAATQNRLNVAEEIAALAADLTDADIAEAERRP
ncbi:hypothetical protein CEUSTIGMA_g4647.t1 [Chlamydomonas eustigma]|uniref:Uncharacterized protein n=1 Tax=Chlamydomonas eustigma TaxID=1157962 RepID=A0A250X2A3_9CHLO|nr:hypothetical protein CEUSTIGMA_g4647.t1 [Chlamydomonas eustigma]|eukprot:GAX77201.1 hypothetical protein CEUSTIGMA_g4647.t1 [Chlamydomonas eustigma]